MGLYGRYVLPRVVHLTCGTKPTMRQRRKVVPLASGRVLEVGIGSGLNLPFYDPANVAEVVGLDPSEGMTALATEAARAAPFPVEFVTAGAEEIPVDDESFDCLVLTYTLCSIPNVDVALREMARVLKPGGALLFCEHGLAPDAGVRRWQHRVEPIWKRLGGGCHLSRDIPALIRDGGFEITGMETMYLPGWRPASFNYWGSAVPKRAASEPSVVARSMRNEHAADLDAVLKAAVFAAEKHRTQRRKDRDASPYINHPLAVARELTRHGVHDLVAVQAALLHDTVEDTETSEEELVETFGHEVARVVMEVTDDKALPKQRRKELQVEHAPALSDAARLVKLGDKICNARDVHSNPPAGWTTARRREYLEWTRRVVDGCRGLNRALEREFDDIVATALKSLVE